MTTQLKRKFEEDLDPESIPATLCDLIRKVLGRSVGEVILEFVQNERLSLQDLKELTEKPPSFVSANWDKVAREFGLDPSTDKYQLPAFFTPHAYLPPSLHKRVMKEAIQWLDRYQERGAYQREAARLRILDAVCLIYGSPFCDFIFSCSMARSSCSALQRPCGR
jgi:hypothetical protein